MSIASPSFAATYAPDDRRASKTAGGQTTYYVYDEDGSPSPLIEEQMNSGSPSVSMGWGMGADGLRARYSPTTSGPNYMFEYDPQGSLVQRQTGSNTSYSALDTAMYDAYGSKLNDVDVFTGGAEPVRDAVGFQGQFGAYTDNETGLVLMGHRYYSPGTGRFLTRDPKGYGGGINLYGFTGNNPVNENDPSGLAPTLSGQPVQDPIEESLERLWQNSGRSVYRLVIRPAGRGLVRVAGTAGIAATLFFMSEGRVADDSTGPGSPYALQHAAKKLKEPRGGTYILRDPESGKVMRTGMATNLTKRRSDHKKTYPTLTFEIDRRSDDLDARRGREQIIHDMFNPPLNRQNPISTKNNTPEEVERMMKAGRKL